MDVLADLTAPVAPALDDVLEIFDAELRSDLPFVNRLTEQVRAFRGKLLRPKLLLLCGRAAGGLRREHIVLAAVVEMVHMATLVHDDVLDEADVRRRSPTVNRLVGNEGAVLLGDYLISHAYHLCSSLGSTRYSRRIATVTNTVCEGELMQIYNRGNWALTEREYLQIIRRKTASLVALCGELGAAGAGAARATARRLAAFGSDLGMAFQIVDDILDLTATQDQLGKTVGRDVELDKLTLPVIRLLEQAAEHRRQEILALLSDRSPGRGEILRALLADSGCLDDAMDTARAFVQSAVAHLDDLPAGDARDALVCAAEFVLNRRQ